jgi:hypothetical protein
MKSMHHVVDPQRVLWKFEEEVLDKTWVELNIVCLSE